MAETEAKSTVEGEGPDHIATDLAAQYWDRLRYFAMRRLRDPALAEDVAQETLRRTLEALRENRVRQPEALGSFLFETARNVCSHRARSAGRESRAYERLATPESDRAEDDDPLEGLVSAEERQHVQHALERLGGSDRDVLVLAYVEGLDNSKIAERLGLKSGAVRVRRHRALERLAALLGVTRRTKRGHL